MRGLSLKDAPFLARVQSSAFGPNSFPGLVRWHSADSYSLSDGTVITTTWPNLVSGGSVATPLSTKEPTFKTNIFGSKPAIRFVAPKSFTFTPAQAIGYPNNGTICVVTKSIGDWIFLSNSGGGNFQVRLARSSANQNSFFPGSGAEAISGTITETLASARANFFRANASTIFFRVNKNAYSSAAVSVGPTLSVNQIGLSDTGPDVGDMGEIMIWTTLLSAADCDNLYDNYLKPKWGLP